jgi:hypothetical protein
VAADQDLLLGFELHSEETIPGALAAGSDPLRPIPGKLPVRRLVEMYTRSPRLSTCLQAMLDAGASLDDPWLQTVLLEDGSQLGAAIRADLASIHRPRTLECAYTSLPGVSRLHVAAEYNSVNAAKIPLAKAVDVDRRAAVDADGGSGSQSWRSASKPLRGERALNGKPWSIASRLSPMCGGD